MYRVENQLLPNNIQKLYVQQTGQMLNVTVVQYRESAYGISEVEGLKTCRTLSEFKQIFKNNVLNRYRMDEQRGGIM